MIIELPSRIGSDQLSPASVEIRTPTPVPSNGSPSPR